MADILSQLKEKKITGEENRYQVSLVGFSVEFKGLCQTKDKPYQVKQSNMVNQCSGSHINVKM